MTTHTSPLTPLSFLGRKALVVGLGDTGAACVRWLLEHDTQVRGTDTRAEPPHAQHLREAFPEVKLSLGGFATADFDWADLIVASPGVALATPELQAAIEAGKEVVGDVELFARAIKGSPVKVIAITGSNGKSTVTSLVGHLCAAVGLDTVVAGNIGLPVLEALDNRETLGRDPDVWVLELSSFQLETTTHLRPDAATVLNISQDHMDRYAGLEDYAAAKARRSRRANPEPRRPASDGNGTAGARANQLRHRAHARRGIHPAGVRSHPAQGPPLAVRGQRSPAARRQTAYRRLAQCRQRLGRLGAMPRHRSAL
jgi:hypothetical protein